ncbi:MAG: hypothetical protein JWN65_2732 [Solirubrobacterales bacterium]|nr:hypothetical protein [Solirubrobacterales bacterium]
MAAPTAVGSICHGFGTKLAKLGCSSREKGAATPRGLAGLVLAARVLAHAVMPGPGVAVKARERLRRAATLRSRRAVALQLDRSSFADGVGVLLVLAAVGGINHDELRPTPVDARNLGPLEGQPDSAAHAWALVIRSG